MLRLTEEATRQFLKKEAAIWCALIVASVFFGVMQEYYPQIPMQVGATLLAAATFLIPLHTCHIIFYKGPHRALAFLALMALSLCLSLGLLTLVRWIAYFYF